MQDLMQSKTYRETFETGELKGKREVAMNMFKKGMEFPLIIELTGLAEEEVTKVKKEIEEKES